MKKTLLVLAYMFGMSIAASAEQTAAVMLKHNSNITTYEPEQINDAIAAAENGDVIFLTAGDFPEFTINKQISVRGSGMQTVIKGNINIDNSDVTLNEIFIGYLQVYGDGYINVKSRVKGLKISQCRLSGGIDFQAITEDSYIDRCYIGYGSFRCFQVNGLYTEYVTVNGNTSSYTRSYLQGLTVTNCSIDHINGHESIYQDISFINCYIKCRVNNSFSLCGVKIINSIIYKGSSTAIGLNKAEVINSSYGGVGIYNDTKLTNCYDVAIEDYEASDLYSNGYTGNDGTVIGPMGGNTPYTLEPTIPKVISSTLKVDPKKQELDAIISVSPK